jgi:ubiquinone/menaquinone biosynthesis C-methylase UbiE
MQSTLEHPYQSGHFAVAVADDDDAPRPGGIELSLRAIHCAGFAVGEPVLDLGCGDGAGTKLLRRHGCAPIALDIASERVAQAACALPGLATVVADARHLPFADESLAGILAECSLSLAGYTAETLAECYRVLRPGGRLAVTDVFARIEAAERTPLPGCLAGLATRGDILVAMAAAGLKVQRWEDHSDVLKSFLAQLIFSGHGSEALWTGDGSAYATALRERRPGYFLLIAAKEEG